MNRREAKHEHLTGRTVFAGLVLFAAIVVGSFARDAYKKEWKNWTKISTVEVLDTSAEEN